MSDGIHYNTLCTYVSDKVNEQDYYILGSYMNDNNDTNKMSLQKQNNSLTHNGYITMTTVSIKSKSGNCVNYMSNENSVDSLTIESSINTFSFKEVEENILCDGTTNVLQVVEAPSVHIASTVYKTIQDFSQDPLLGSFNFHILDKVVKKLE